MSICPEYLLCSKANPEAMENHRASQDSCKKKKKHNQQKNPHCMSGLTDEGWCSGRWRERGKQTGSAPGAAAISFCPSLLSGFAARAWVLAVYSCSQLFTAVHTGSLLSRCTGDRSLSRDCCAGREVMRSEPLRNPENA